MVAAVDPRDSLNVMCTPIRRVSRIYRLRFHWEPVLEKGLLGGLMEPSLARREPFGALGQRPHAAAEHCMLRLQRLRLCSTTGHRLRQ